MLCLDQDQLTQKLRQTNSRLRFWLESLALDQANAGAPKPQIISELLSELLRTGEWLRSGMPQADAPQFEAEFVEYRRNLELLRSQMPAIHRHLLEERARLEGERTRIESAMEWAQGSNQTL